MFTLLIIKAQTNREMKEKISRNKISRHYKSFFGLENMGLGENDNLMIDWGESLINDLINQEVEKRIKERIPTEGEMKKRQKNRGDYLRELGYPPQVIAKYQDAIKETWEWLRNQITER